MPGWASSSWTLSTNSLSCRVVNQVLAIGLILVGFALSALAGASMYWVLTAEASGPTPLALAALLLTLLIGVGLLSGGVAWLSALLRERSRRSTRYSEENDLKKELREARFNLSRQIEILQQPIPNPYGRPDNRALIGDLSEQLREIEQLIAEENHRP
jgi:hypothetical protein